MDKVLCFLIGACVLLTSSATIANELSNGYFFLGARDGWFDQLKFDPKGQEEYGENLIVSLSIGEIPQVASGMKVEQTDTSLTFRNLKLRIPFTREQSNSTHPIPCPPGASLGARFTVETGWMKSAGGKFPTWHQSDAGFTLTVYRLPDGDLARRERIASQKFTEVRDNSFQSLDFDPQPPGEYYLEMSEVSRTNVGWWGKMMDEANPSPTVYMDGRERPDISLTVVFGGHTEIPGDWTVTLNGPNLQSVFKPLDPEQALPPDARHCMVTPWEKAGYDVSRFPFSRFYTDIGRHMLVQQLKRRPHSGQLQSGAWIYAMGRKDFDLRFNLKPGQKLAWDFEDHSMTWKFNGPEWELDVLPHSDELPDYYPVFYSSDPKFDKILNEFYYSHALNFGVGTPAGWKEWQALIFSWTANPQLFESRGHLTGMKQRPDGYVYTWGGTEGWPFPYKDEDKDGVNDYDTRHFSTNAILILASWRYFSWTRDLEFLREVMPKLRSAMAYQLDQLQGRKGIIIADAVGHEGKHDCIGSNYWDILPFGHKDAFCNSYYYASLNAMSELEEFAEAAGIPDKGESPNFYKALAPRVRQSYNREFWDDSVGRYVGCVDVDGVKHDYGFTFVNLEAAAYGLADKAQVERIYRWMETEKTSSGKADTYTKWILAPRANTIHNPPRNAPQEPKPSWWFLGWAGTPYGEQCQDGGAILYTSYYDIIARAKYLGAENAFKRFREILDRYNKPDRLMGGSPLYLGESTQGGPGGSPGAVGVEGEFPESGMVPTAFLYAFLGIDADVEGLKIRPNLPSHLKFAGVRNLYYAGTRYDIKVTNDSVEIIPLNVANPFHIKHTLKPGETFLLRAGQRTVTQ